jgi:DNA-binding transcriptional regulator YbjK
MGRGEQLHVQAELAVGSDPAYELYTLAARRPEFRTITEGWMQASRRALERHFTPDTARALDAYIEGAALHIALDNTPPTPDQTRSAIRRLTRDSATDR